MELTLINQTQLQQVIINKLDELPDLITVYFDIKHSDQQIKFNDELIDPTKSFLDYSIKNGDLLIVDQKIESYENHIEDVMDQALITHEMLYLKAECNNYVFKIFIDTGAQISAMSPHMAKLLDLSIDTRMSGNAYGVGVAKIIGVVYNCDIKLENNIHLPVNFRIMEIGDDLMLLGLDFLYNYACQINMANRVIIINNKEFKLLNEMQIKELGKPYDCTKENIKMVYSQLISNCDIRKKDDMIEILNKILTNIIKNPSEEKYKNININNKAINDIIKENKDFVKFMNKIGFVTSGDKLKFIDNVKMLKYTKSIMCA